MEMRKQLEATLSISIESITQRVKRETKAKRKRENKKKNYLPNLHLHPN